MVRILVIGSTGRIGTMLRSVWGQNTAQGTGATFAYQTRHRQNVRGNDPVWDILDPPPTSVTRQAPFDCMIVLAGIVPRAGVDFTLNTTIGQAAVAAASQLGIPRILLASTSAVYGNYSDAPLGEGHRLDPVNDYGRSKHAMEDACLSQAHAAGLDLCCLRIGNVAGADALLLNGVALAQDKTLQLDVFADGGTPLRSYIGPITLGRVLLSLARCTNALPDCLNIAAPHPVTMGALAQAADMPVTLRPTPTGMHQNITLDCTALTALHSFAPAASDPVEMVREWRSVAVKSRPERTAMQQRTPK